MRKLHVLPLLSLLPALLAGCPLYGGDDGERTRPYDPCVGSGCDRFCDGDWECASGEYCSGGECRTLPPPSSCVDSSDCNPGQVCQGGACVTPTVPPTPTCVTHADCSAGQLCTGGTCVATDDRCSTDADCDGGLCQQRGVTCANCGTCVPRPDGYCTQNDDCSDGQACVNNTCTSLEDACQFDYQCGAGRACVNNACTPICGDNDDCGSGSTCEGGFCRPTTPCADGTACAGDLHCAVGGQCLPACESGECADPADICGSDGLCHPDTAPRPFCSSDAGCAMGHRCVDGVCRTPCPSGTAEECRRFDDQLEVCASDSLCYSRNETMPECTTADDCTGEDACINAICR